MSQKNTRDDFLGRPLINYVSISLAYLESTCYHGFAFDEVGFPSEHSHVVSMNCREISSFYFR
jgi:hypothetical protein